MKPNRKAEDYMKAVCRLREGGVVRGVDIARELGVTKPTVSVALREMEAAGLITIEPNRRVVLTEEGEQLAHSVIERYDTLCGLLTALGVEEQTAREDACRMEHGMSEESLGALNRLLQYLHTEKTPFGQKS